MTREESLTKPAKTWENMKQRCYSESYQKLYPTYKGCKVCKEWLDYETFKKWFNTNYVDKFVLDKDILFDGNKIYSPETCVFVPQIVNGLYKQYTDKKFTTGIFHNGSNYEVKISKFGRRCNLGSFYNKEHAETAYQNGKNDYKLQLAEMYKELLDIRVYNKLKGIN